MVLDLEELSEKYAPDLNVPQSQKDWYRNDDGKWYSLVSFYYGPERCTDEFGGFLVTHNSNFCKNGFTGADRNVNGGSENKGRLL